MPIYIHPFSEILSDGFKLYSDRISLGENSLIFKRVHSLLAINHKDVIYNYGETIFRIVNPIYKCNLQVHPEDKFYPVLKEFLGDSKSKRIFKTLTVVIYSDSKSDIFLYINNPVWQKEFFDMDYRGRIYPGNHLEEIGYLKPMYYREFDSEAEVFRVSSLKLEKSQ